VLSSVSILAVGFFLGIRHATDPDHVVAIATIITRQRKISRAALIGICWGAGHTLTIVALGVAIIVFGLAIPVRVGLTMELAVSLMLILLVLATIRNPRWALAYLLLFGIGTVAGMVLITVSIASALRMFGIVNGKWSQRLALVSGLLSVAFGGLVAIQIVLANGLFTGHPIWTPKL
jgi:high-affinity nickel-transport protein